ncbi:hypothetical protein [Brevibacterium aurantiacum]|uniref:hypothetical protein n=1 Tax=Brevibacterium aurantiacum TaxID=273384 RepID=UPI000DF2A9C9|nr:hypothetical protein [Brevibacterium aurantiacum]AZL06583.1 hypothetical protein CXR24_14090 [Brevibacterium aurantiacum]MDN5585735.1 hypothetical protein [Brevibacterium sp.]RCS92205.1 hypothetical protein CIK61_16980 [Brevibacterium aurantiacum]
MDATAVLRAADTAARSTSDDPIAMVVDGVHAMAEELWADARRSDETGLTDAKIVQSLDRIGCFRLTAPPRCGGLGEGAGAVLQTARSLARFHPSAAWNVVVSASHVATAQCFERDPFATLAPGAGDLQMAGSYGSRVAQSWREGDHHVVNGTWSMASNAQHAHWATIDAAHQDLGRVIMIMPLSELTVVDTWQAIGMRGTASHTLTADGLEVGEDSLIPFSRFTEIPEGPDSETLAARLPKVLRTSIGLAGVALGTAQALADEVARRGCYSPTTFSAENTGVSPQAVFSVELGAARSRLRSAQLLLESVADGLDAIGRAHQQPTPPQVVEARSNLGRVSRDIADAVHELCFLAGSATAVEGNDLGRLWRDAQVAVHHGALAPAAGFATDGNRAVHNHAAERD